MKAPSGKEGWGERLSKVDWNATRHPRVWSRMEIEIGLTMLSGAHGEPAKIVVNGLLLLQKLL